ncbi:MAG: type 1 glutamine amidotransferase-like domain-containing protein [Polyangiaceae bacterium]|nr:type 1 glutamine amidotransferase-like domain-containing protein [Polyangiaceae bacterium]
MLGTALIYSSHDRSNYLHDHFIVQRALRGNKQILFLPMSETVQNGSELERQEFSWGTFRWFFSFYRRYGLDAFPFFWTSGLSKGDVDALWDAMWNAEVVILGGGNPRNGIRRYKDLGHRFDGEWGKFGRLLHERRARGLLTVGFSAGADQLCDSLFARTYGDEYHGRGFGLVRNTMVTLHHESSRNGDLAHAARKFPHNMVFGLPNDSGINHDWGRLPSGNIWQVYEFVIDNSWDEPSDAFHIKTRMGAKIDHIYNDGRHWSFDGGDLLVRCESPDGHWREAWMRCGGRWIHYQTQSPSSFRSVEQILAHH